MYRLTNCEHYIINSFPLFCSLESYFELKTTVLNQLREHVLSRVLEPDHLLKLTVINMAALYVIRLIASSMFEIFYV